MRIFWIIFLIFIPNVAFANSMAPVFPLLSGVGWVALPIIISVEAFYYYSKSINNPIRLSLYANLISATIGLLPAILTFPIMLGPIIEPTDPSVFYMGALATFGAIIIHWWLSSFVEYKFSQKSKRWEKSYIPPSIFYKANAITYGLIAIVFISILVASAKALL